VAGKFKAALRPIPGAWVEEKGLTLSVHWRAVPRSAQRTFHQLLKTLTAPYLRRGVIHLTRGKRVVEIRPAVDWDKGMVVDWLLTRIAGRHAATRHWITYLGDDQTDEDAFRVVNRLGGTSVFVGNPRRRTAARFWLKDPQEVRRWLAALERWKRWNSSNSP
jgi:trehalose 6-phosphate phosphatase